MPLKYKKKGMKKLAARRRPALRRPRRGYTTWVNKRSLNPIPQRSIVTMKYAESISSNIAAGATYRQLNWNLNSVFDPNRTGTGRQPYGRDTLATLYNRYRVIGCHWAVSAVTLDGSSTGSGVYALSVACLPANEEISPVTSLAEIREKPRARYILQANGAPVKQCSGYTSIPSLMGRTKAQYMADDRFQALETADPNELAVLNTYIGFMNDASVGGGATNIQYNIQLKYVVEWFDPKTLATS